MRDGWQPLSPPRDARDASARVPQEHVHFIESDIFGWEPARGYDVVFFCAWLSHVPPQLREELAELGWDVMIHTIEWRFYYATGRKTVIHQLSGSSHP